MAPVGYLLKPSSKQRKHVKIIIIWIKNILQHRVNHSTQTKYTFFAMLSWQQIKTHAYFECLLRALH
jgi:hypothetical protein